MNGTKKSVPILDSAEIRTVWEPNDYEKCRNPNVQILADAEIGTKAGLVFSTFGFQTFGP